MSDVEMDAILARMEQALGQLDAAQGSLVRVPRAELELLEQLEAARDLMMSVLQTKERQLLTDIFGGDCVRVSRVRAVLEAVRFSTMADRHRELRLRSCLSACESVEQVLGDLGLGFALRLAQDKEKALLTQRRSSERRCQPSSSSKAFAPPARQGSDAPDVRRAGEASAELDAVERQSFQSRTSHLDVAETTLDFSMRPAAAQASPDVGGRDQLSVQSRIPLTDLVDTPDCALTPADAEVPIAPALPATPAATAPPAKLPALAAPVTSAAPATSAAQVAPATSAMLATAVGPAAPTAPLLDASSAAEVPLDSEEPVVPSAALAPAELALPAPEVPSVPAAQAPEAPSAAEAREAPEAPSAAEAREAPEAPSAAEAREAPEVLEAAAAQEELAAPAAGYAAADLAGEDLPEEDFPEEESALLPEPLEEEKPMDEQLEEEAAAAATAKAAAAAAAAAGAADTACGKPTALAVARRPSFEQAAAALRGVVHPAAPAGAECGRAAAAGQSAAAEVSPGAGASGAPLEPEAEPLVLEPGECSDSARGRGTETPTPCSLISVSEGEYSEEGSEPDIDHTYVMELPPWLERLLQRLFAFYAGTDGTSAGVGIGLTRFRSFLRDAGILRGHGSADASVAMQSLSQSASELQGRPSVSSGRRRSSVQSLSRGGVQLPLQVFPEPPFSLVQADLMHVTARERQPFIRSHMTCDAFFWAVADIAFYCQQQGLLECGGAPDEVVLAFCEKVIVPLGEFLGLGEQELRVALAVREEAAPLFYRARQGLAAAFAKYARGAGGQEPYRRGHWTLQALRRFASELDLVAELSHSALQRVFDTCVQHEVGEERGVDGLMSFACFKLAFIMIAQRVHNAPDCTPTERLALLLLRLGAAQGASDLGAAARSVLGAPAKAHRGSGQQRLPPRTSLRGR